MTIGRLRSLNFERPTPLAVGQLLNQTGIDELSQLFDVLQFSLPGRNFLRAETKRLETAPLFLGFPPTAY
jgi:hypothetical protein